MNEYDIKRLALILAVNAEIEGMKALNMFRERRGETIAHSEDYFYQKAEELRVLACLHIDQL